MAYNYGDGPDDRRFTIRDNRLFLEFTCPRCGIAHSHEIDPNEIGNYLDIPCENPLCKIYSSVYGYVLELRGLSFSDRYYDTYEHPLLTDLPHNEVLSALTTEPRNIDDISSASGLNYNDTRDALFDLERRELICRDGYEARFYLPETVRQA